MFDWCLIGLYFLDLVIVLLIYFVLNSEINSCKHFWEQTIAVVGVMWVRVNAIFVVCEHLRYLRIKVDLSSNSCFILLDCWRSSRQDQRQKSGEFVRDLLKMGTYYWSRDMTHLLLWRHCCQVIVVVLPSDAVASLGNQHKINDVIMTSRPKHVTKTSSQIVLW